jgi:hypothetical protein
LKIAVKKDDEGQMIERWTLNVTPWQTIFMSEYSPLRRRFFRSSCRAVRGAIGVEAAMVMYLVVRGEMMICARVLRSM